MLIYNYMLTKTNPKSMPINTNRAGNFDLNIKNASGKSSPNTTYNIAPEANDKDKASPIELIVPI